jgi:hypothetical protein
MKGLCLYIYYLLTTNIKYAKIFTFSPYEDIQGVIKILENILRRLPFMLFTTSSSSSRMYQ